MGNPQHQFWHLLARYQQDWRALNELTWLRLLLLALAYFVCARLSLLLALPPGYASPIWPAAGVALLGLFAGGLRLWPGVLLGSFLANSTPGLWLNPSGLDAGINLVIALGATLQAVVGLMLLRWVLDKERSDSTIIRSLLVAVPLASLVSATVGITTLWLSGRVASEHLFSNGLAWWVGDSIGVLMFLPLCYLPMLPKFRRWRTYLAVMVPVLLCVVVLVVAQLFLQRVEEAQARREKVQEGEYIEVQLREAVARLEHEVDALSRFLRATPDPTPQGFNLYTQSAVESPGVQALAWLPRVSQEQRQAFEQRAGQLLGMPFLIKEFDEQGKPMLAKPRIEYFPAFLFQPLESNRQALGFDVLSHPLRREALQTTLRTRLPQATQVLDLVGTDKPAQGGLIFNPVYAEDGVLRGMALVVFRLDGLLQVLERESRRLGLLACLTQRQLESTRILYESGDYRQPMPKVMDRYIDLAGTQLRLQLKLAPGYWVPGASGQAQLLSLGGLGLIWLMAAFLLNSAYRTSLVHAQVDKRTAALRQEIKRRERTERELQKAVEAAQLAGKSKDAFLVTMSHEIRTPLNGLLGMLDLLSEASLPAGHQQNLQVAKRAGIGLKRIIDDVLDYAKIESGKLQLEHRPFAVTQLAEDILATHQNQAAAKGVQLRQQLDPELAPWLLGDELRLGQILHNLINNALKFTEQGQVILEAQVIQQRAEWQRIRLSVKDSGIGIASSVQERLFRPFTQAYADTSRLYGGTGLGLSICQRLAELMDARLSLQSQEGQGSCFSLELTLAKAVAPPKQAAELNNLVFCLHDQPWCFWPRGQGLRVVAVDDNPTNRLLLQRQLAHLGIQVELAENGEQALALCLATTAEKGFASRHAGGGGEQVAVDVLITDCHMPVMDGYALTQALRQHYLDQTWPLIIGWTANAMPEEQERCRQAGMDALLTKPVNLEQLTYLLQTWGVSGDTGSAAGDSQTES
ncbi:CHASE domain-containing protein [Balneatrix alpica]|uniref:histidine kinase n=1 Tax=Balneatrix alpica TaxID=75684 RepID=A0ABV5ZBX2_9GAMM|nr:CHASE domain-containing protein [Balneatrix alpica]